MSEPGPLSIRQLARLLYTMGRTFDGLQSTFTATEEFLHTGNPNVLVSKADYNLLLDLRQSADYTSHYDYAHRPIDLDFIKGINAQLTRTAAIDPGKLRDKHSPRIGEYPIGQIRASCPRSRRNHRPGRKHHPTKRRRRPYQGGEPVCRPRPDATVRRRQ